MPSALLRPYIECYTIQERPLPAIAKVVPQPNVVMGFQYRGRLAWQKDSGKIPLATAGITGILHGYRMFESSADLASILVYFKPLAAASFLPLPVHEIRQQSISLYDLLPAALLRGTEEELADAATDHQRIAALERLLTTLLQPKQPDAVVAMAYQQIMGAGGNVRIGDIARQVHISPRQLERRFAAAAGASPRQFASLVRFRHVLQEASVHNRLTSLGLEAGYADQSHFIRQFKQYTGTTPTKYFSRH